MEKTLKVGLVGDCDASITAHQCIPAALKIAADSLDVDVDSVWLPTDRLSELTPNVLREYDAFWCVPGSPYKNRRAVIEKIQYARINDVPYLGTCGGFQHAILEFAIHQLCLSSATLEEEEPQGEMLLISALPCRLTDESRKISISKNSKLREIMGTGEISEEYRCGFGMNPMYSHYFNDSFLKFVAFNEEEVPQAFVLEKHPFFVGTAFQPERSARTGKSHPLIRAFLQAAL
ncbi:MAG: glutamine amidotransferase-related protein [Bdellovibrionia bacterium]